LSEELSFQELRVEDFSSKIEILNDFKMNSNEISTLRGKKQKGLNCGLEVYQTFCTTELLH